MFISVERLSLVHDPWLWLRLPKSYVVSDVALLNLAERRVITHSPSFRSKLLLCYRNDVAVICSDMLLFRDFFHRHRSAADFFDMHAEAYTSGGSVGLLNWTIRPAVDGDVASHSFKPVVVRPSGEESAHAPCAPMAYHDEATCH